MAQSRIHSARRQSRRKVWWGDVFSDFPDVSYTTIHIRRMRVQTRHRTGFPKVAAKARKSENSRRQRVLYGSRRSRRGRGFQQLVHEAQVFFHAEVVHELALAHATLVLGFDAALVRDVTFQVFHALVAATALVRAHDPRRRRLRVIVPLLRVSADARAVVIVIVLVVVAVRHREHCPENRRNRNQTNTTPLRVQRRRRRIICTKYDTTRTGETT